MTMPTSCDRVLVVVPARDEAALLPDCLAALRRAVEHAQAVWPALEVRVTVVLDSCVDDSAALLAQHPWVHTVSVDLGVVGAVRRVGIEEAVRLAEAARVVDPRRTWVLCTDADSTVSSPWVVRHLEARERGAGLVVGRVEPDPAGLDTDVLHRWRSRHRPEHRRLHVHGANLGFALSHYQEVGGFAPLSAGEDADLVARLRAAGVPWALLAEAPTRTSSRLAGRAPAGFAAYLLALGHDMMGP